MKKLLAQKRTLIILIISTLSLVLIALLVLFANRNGSAKLAEVTPSQDNTIVTKVSVNNSDIPSGYIIDNQKQTALDTLLLKDSDVPKLNLDKYCKEYNPSDINCKYIKESYVNFVWKESDPRLSIRVSTEIPKDSEAGSNFLKEYKENILEMRGKSQCVGGLLTNKDNSIMIYGIVDGGKNDNGIYTILDNIKTRTGYEYFFRCDKLDELK